jgi:WD40 repeat protein
VLIALLKDEDVCIRRLAAAALGTIGSRARAALPTLLETASHDKDSFLRGIARTTLLDVDRETAEKAGIVDHFIFWSPQPRLRTAIDGTFFLDSPMPILADGNILAWEDMAITLRELATGEVLTSFQRPADCAPPTVFSPDGKTVASARQDEMTVKVWELATAKEVAVLRGHTDAITCLAFSPDGKALASGSRDKTVKLWALSDGKNIATLLRHTASVSAVAFSPDGRSLASGGAWDDRTVKLWDLSTRTERASQQHDPMWGGVLCLAFSPDSKTLASGSWESNVMLVDVATGKVRATLDAEDESGSLDSVAFSPDGKYVAYVSWDKIFLCDVATGKNIAKILAEPGNVDGAGFTPDGRILAVTRTTDDHRESLWEFAARRP